MVCCIFSWASFIQKQTKNIGHCGTYLIDIVQTNGFRNVRYKVNTVINVEVFDNTDNIIFPQHSTLK